jgi:hypothetical protein
MSDTEATLWLLWRGFLLLAFGFFSGWFFCDMYKSKSKNKDAGDGS